MITYQFGPYFKPALKSQFFILRIFLQLSLYFCVFQSGSVESPGTQVLVLGLDGAGKTSLLSCWATGSPEADVKPTQGFNAVSINRDDLHVDFLESESVTGCE